MPHRTKKVLWQVSSTYLFRFVHGVLQQAARNLYRHNPPIGNVVLDECSELRSFTLTLFPQQISSRQVLESERVHNFLTLRSFSRACMNSRLGLAYVLRYYF
jgi:hypothetical protein